MVYSLDPSRRWGYMSNGESVDLDVFDEVEEVSKAIAISFGKTSDRLHQKTVTRRTWSDRRAKTFTRYFDENRIIPALDKNRRYGGKEIASLRLTEAPYQEALADMPESDVKAEGYPELSKQEFIDRFFSGESDRVVWVVRFQLIGNRF